MSQVTEIINVLKRDWTRPRGAIHRGQRCPFLLACTFANGPADPVWQSELSVPEDVREFWMKARSATLFKDQLYGQWGLEVLEPGQALLETARHASNRPEAFVRSDLVLARFFGDSDLVVVACNSDKTDFGSVAIALPIDKRGEWPVVASSLGEFLRRLVEVEGDKYWETRA